MERPSQESSINAMVHAATNEPDISKGVRGFLKAVTQLTHSDSATIYKLYLNESKYILLAQYDDRTGDYRHFPSTPGIDVGILLTPPISCSVVEQAIITREIISPYRAGIVIPVVRGDSCVGVLQLDPEIDVTKYLIEFARGLLLSLFERQSSLELLKALQRPIDFTQPLEQFLDDILLLTADASKMPFIQIHELDTDTLSLRCIAQFGFSNVDNISLDYYPLESFSTFSTAVKSGATIVERVNSPLLNLLHQREELTQIKSLVIAPIKVGSGIFGTLSFGAACPYDYSPLEIAGFESIANGIGTAITNSRNAHLLRELSIIDDRIGLSISGLEVAQAARHEVLGAVDDCLANLATIQTHLKNENLIEIEKVLERFEQRLSNISIAIEKIKNASRAPDDTLESCSLIEIWKQARALVSAKLDHERIQARITHLGKEKDIHIEVLPDSLRHAFLHLLLNSIDAFKGRRKSDRLITVTIDPQSDAAIDLKIRYVDNAVGIDPSQFKQWTDADPSKDVKTLIFDKGITTKASGSGYGLYLVRTILTRHHGSIELVNYRGGVVFDITLPKDLRIRMERKDVK